MARSRDPWPVLLTVLLLASLTGPLSAEAQSTETFCDPKGGQDIPAASERPHQDFVVTLENVRFAIGDDDPETPPKQGAYHLTSDTGRLVVDVKVNNAGTPVGGGGGGEVLVRLSLTQPNGQGIVEDHRLAKPNRGSSTTETVEINLTQSGRHVLSALVNPLQGNPVYQAETCNDPPNTPNPECGGSPCSFDYGDVGNTARTGLLVKGRPDLVVTQIQADGPVRAVEGTHNDARATVRATIQNVGTIPAFNLDQLQPGAATIRVQFQVAGGGTGTGTFKQLAPGAATTVEAVVRTHDLVDSFNVTATVDDNDKVNESDEADNAHTATLPIPTPDLAISVLTGLPTVDGAHIIPKGDDLELTVLLQNLGDARAAQAGGEPFDVKVLRDFTEVHATTLTLQPLSSQTLVFTDAAADLDTEHDYIINVDGNDVVLESSESNNQLNLKVVVADYDFDLDVKEVHAKATVPPGVEGRVPFEIVNTGTVGDTFTLSLPSADRDAGRFVDVNGFTIGQVELKKGGSLKGELVFMVPATAAKDSLVSTEIRVHSAGDGDIKTRNITFTVGDDTVAPTIRLHDPASGYLAGDKVVLRVTDNVNVTKVETDATGSLAEITPDQPEGSLYTIDVTGRPTRFSLTVRATDSTGNAANQTVELVRDRTDPRITEFLFTPDRPALPGSKVTIVVAARDDTAVDRVHLRIFQPRPDGQHYDEQFNLTRSGANHQLRDWVVPERPGHYVFNATVYDQAGNTVSQRKTLTVNGLDVRAPPGRERAIVNVAQPSEGDRIVFSWVIENTSPTFETGDFVVGFILDDRREIGRQTVNLGPGERRTVSFVWFATPGPHTWNIVLDRTLLVAEDDEANNVLGETTDTLFPNNPLFRTAQQQGDDGSPVFEAVLDHWYMPVLFVATALLFAIALVLGRRPGA